MSGGISERRGHKPVACVRSRADLNLDGERPMSTPRAETGERPQALAVSVGRVNLLGVQVTASALLSCAEHERRSGFGLGAVTNPALLDYLLSLPVRQARRDPVSWAETSALPGGIVDRADDGYTVTRLLELPLALDAVIVSAAPGRALRAVQDASLFAGFTCRWVRHQQTAVPDTAVLEGKLCGVGLLGSQGQVLVPAEPPTSAIVDGWAWLLAEKTYRRWLKQAAASR